MVFVLLRPQTQEDDGRYQYHGAFGSQRQAEQFIIDAVKKSRNYYSPGDFIVAKQI